jgi:hypothetical protein
VCRGVAGIPYQRLGTNADILDLGTLKSVLTYPTETYGPTAANPRARPGAPERRRKLWRVDGPMSDEQWMELVGLFFRGNELIGEHFEDAFAERV